MSVQTHESKQLNVRSLRCMRHEGCIEPVLSTQAGKLYTEEHSITGDDDVVLVTM